MRLGLSLSSGAYTWPSSDAWPCSEARLRTGGGLTRGEVCLRTSAAHQQYITGQNRRGLDRAAPALLREAPNSLVPGSVNAVDHTVATADVCTPTSYCRAASDQVPSFEGPPPCAAFGVKSDQAVAGAGQYLSAVNHR